MVFGVFISLLSILATKVGVVFNFKYQKHCKAFNGFWPTSSNYMTPIAIFRKIAKYLTRQ